MNDNQILEEILNDFNTYLRYVYSYIGLPDSTPLQKRIGYHLNKMPNRIIIEAARGVGKSYIAAIYCTWRLLRNQEEKVIIVSASSAFFITIAIILCHFFALPREDISN